MKLLYIEDDATARDYIQKGLEERGFCVDVVGDAENGEELAARGSYDLLILDVVLPGRDGFELLRRLRARGVRTPVLFLSARGEVADRVQGLELGADDYLPKPFAFAELLARVRAVARRRPDAPSEIPLQVDDLVLDTRRHRVERAGRRIDLTPKEFALLQYLMEHEGQVISRTMILEKIWGWGFDSYSNLIDVHVNHLRKKMDRGFATKLIHTVKGVGYVLEAREDASS